MTSWIVVSDASRARIFELERGRELKLIQELQHPQSRQRTSDLVTDDRGRTEKGGSSMIRSATEPHTSPHEVEADAFAHQLALYLHESRVRHNVDQFAVVAPPHFLGLLKKSMDPHLEKAVVSSVHKDLVNFSTHQIAEHLADTIQSLHRNEANAH